MPLKPYDIAADTGAGGDYFTARDGQLIYYKIRVPKTKPIAVILAFHGLGEHTGRYDPFFEKLTAAGFVVKGMDERGHGRTLRKNAGSVPGYHNSFEHVFGDMMTLYELPVPGVAEADAKALPVFVFGHSLGGLLALNFCDKNIKERIPTFKGCIAQAPALDVAPVFFLLKLAVLKLGNLIGKVTQPNGLNLQGINSSAEEREIYQSDPLVHDIISVRLAKDIFEFSDLTKSVAGAGGFTHAVLVSTAEKDSLVFASGGRTFVERCGAADKTFKQFEGDYGHEIHREPALKDEVAALYVKWMTERL
ncbi:Alpha/Beta hydrolase protein [Zopfochytrium polystomum]|nr:Alpha/Beta hydrolase protein [Zopfochytrium polystomum]